MAINLEKGQRINLEKNTGKKLTSFCVGCNWGAIVREKKVARFFGLSTRIEREMQDVDLDLSCIMTDTSGKMLDHIYSPLYREEFLRRYNMPTGKLNSDDRALHHSGDDLKGDQEGDDGLDNEIITVDLTKVDKNISQIFFFLNNAGGKEDFSQIPYASIRMYEGTPSKVVSVFAQYNVAAEPQYAGKKALIMGKLYKHNGDWKFAAIGDAYEDVNLCLTIKRILTQYA